MEKAEEDAGHSPLADVEFIEPTKDRTDKSAPVSFRRVTMAQLVTTLEKFTDSSDKAARRLIYLTWSLIVLTVLLIGLGAMTISDARKSAALQNNIVLNNQLYSGSNLIVMESIKSIYPTLKDNGGDITAFQLNIYLGTFDVIYSAYHNHLLNEEDLCDSFSYYIAITHEDTEVMNYVSDMRKTDPGFFQGFIELYQITSNSKNLSCTPIRKSAPSKNVIEEIASVRHLRA